MDDKRIVELFWERSESALIQTEKKYKNYIFGISRSILQRKEDVEECVNDTLNAAWNSIPPAKPDNLKVYLGRLVRNISINRYMKINAIKRRGEGDLIFEELSEFLPDPASEYSIADEIALRDAVNYFLGTLPKLTRIVFLRRYWYFSSISEIASDYGLSTTNVKVMLHRTRTKFKKYLMKEGIIV